MSHPGKLDGNLADGYEEIFKCTLETEIYVNQNTTTNIRIQY